MKKILIIDDDTLVLSTLSDLLEKESFECITASSGNAGFEKFEKENPDIVVLDIVLPDIDGHEICKKIKSLKNIPVIMMTSKIDSVDVNEAKKSGADDFAVKTSDYSYLLMTLKNLLSDKK